MKTTVHAHKKDLKPVWYEIDARSQPLGRLAVGIATILMGKHRPGYTPNVDTGDFVVVTHAEKIVLTGNKMETKKFETYTGYPGGHRETPIRRALVRKPGYAVREAVRRMLPKNKLAYKMLTKLKVVVGADHDFKAQKPEKLSFKGRNDVYQK